jgi:hypothetical protein
VDIDSYTERSPSGDGIRIMARGTLPEHDRKNGDAEIYGKDRYLTITGQVVDGRDTIRESGPSILRFHAKYIARPQRESSTGPAWLPPTDSDADLLAKARAAKNGAAFASLYDRGDWQGAGYPSQSEADLGLASHLLYWTDGHGPTADRLFRASALMRDKWDSPRGDRTYGADTLARATPSATKIGTVVPVTTERQAPTIEDVEELFRRHFELRDPYVIRLVLGIIASHPIGGDPLWLLLVAPPSGLKTELIRACSHLPGTYPLSELTPNTFASGLNASRDPSLLAKLTNETLLFKDFTTILTMRVDDRQRVLSQLREIYDGSFKKAFGSGKIVDWEGRLGFVAGVTPVIDMHQAVTAVLGERFLLYRVDAPPRTSTGRRALAQMGREPEMRRELADIVGRFMVGLSLPERLPALPERFTDRIAAVADFVTRSRSGVFRDQRTKDLEYVPEPEGPARLAKQTATLLVSLGLLHDEKQPTEEDYLVAYKAATDTVPKHRTSILEALNGCDDYITTGSVAEASGYPTSSARRYLEDLTALGTVQVRKGGPGYADSWTLTDEARSLLEQAAPRTVPQKTDGGLGSAY